MGSQRDWQTQSLQINENQQHLLTIGDEVCPRGIWSCVCVTVWISVHEGVGVFVTMCVCVGVTVSDLVIVDVGECWYLAVCK